jgi:predicted porin
MNKKLLAVAVASALAVPGVAFAQASSVTISGIFKVGFDSIKNDNATSTGSPTGAGNPARLNNQQQRITDNSSRIIFSVNENLGGGLAAIAQVDVRFAPTNSNSNFGGNTFVGLKSTQWGQLTLGRNDLHYGAAPDDTAAKAGALQGAAISLFDFIQVPGQLVAATGRSTAAGVTAAGAINAVNIPIANATRTPNVVKYDTPVWNGFNATVAYSANPLGAQSGDMSIPYDQATANAAPPAQTVNNGYRATRNGYAWNVRPEYRNGPLLLGYSYWMAKPDAPLFGFNAAGGTTGAAAVGSLDQRGDSLYGSYQFGGFKVGVGFNRSRVNVVSSPDPTIIGSGGRAAERDAWSLPMSYVMGPHNFVGHYTKANNVKSDVSQGVTSGTGAYMYSLAYVYDMSARTSLGLTYSVIHNDSYANYTYFTGNGTLGSPDATPVAGERQQLLHLGIKHAF